MSADGSDNGGSGGEWIKTFLVLVAAIVAGFWAIKLTAWLFKTALIVVAVGAVGYLGYGFVKGQIGSDEAEGDEPKQLTHDDELDAAGDRRRRTPESKSATAEIDAALEELKRLKDMRGE